MISHEILKELEEQAKELDFSDLHSLEVVETVNLQQTEEWYAARRFKFTSSSIYKLLTEARTKAEKDNGELGETAKTYVIDKITEEVGGFIPDAYGKAIDWGNEHEDEARDAYVELTGNSVEAVGFVQHTEFYGGSPDSLVLDLSLVADRVGGLEIKCPHNSTNHLKHMLIDSAEYFKKHHKEYYWQCVSHMIVLDCQWCDFFSYDPRLPVELRRFRFRLYRIEADVELLKSKIDKALTYKAEVKEKLKIAA